MSCCRWLRARVPVSVRAEDEHNTMGNRIVVMRGPLPVYIADPLQRLRFVSQAMEGLKEAKQALGAAVIAGGQILPASDPAPAREVTGEPIQQELLTLVKLARETVPAPAPA